MQLKISLRNCYIANGYTVITKALFIPILGMGMMNLICWKSDDCVMFSSLGT